MRRVSKISVLLVAAAAAGGLWGCNDRLDDPTESEGILTIERVEPVNVQADVTPTDPNGMPQTLTSEETSVLVKNRARNTSAGSLSDIAISQSEQFCVDPMGVQVTGGTSPASFIIQSGTTATVKVIAISLAEKQAFGARRETWTCSVRFKGEDLAGNPARSDFATFTVTLADL